MIKDSSKMPMVSIVTPSYNQGEFIEDTILSVKNQNYPSIEHIIVDGSSTDNTLEVIKKYEGTYNLRWISEPDEGQTDAINKGFGMTQGGIIGWLNSDDVYLGEWVISSVVKEFLKEGGDVIFGNDIFISENGKILRIRIFSRFNYNRLLRYGGISQPATFMRKSIIEQNLLRKELNFTMDFEYWLRLGRTYHFHYMNKLLAGNRLHSKRKMIAQREQARQEGLLVRKLYGLQMNWWTTFMIMIFDKPLTFINRIKGIWIQRKIMSGALPLFSFIRPPKSLTTAFKYQLIGPTLRIGRG